MNRTRKLGLSILLSSLLAVGLAACGGADDTAGGSSDSGGEGGGDQLSLVAYSTPEVVYDELIPAFQKTAATARA